MAFIFGRKGRFFVRRRAILGSKARTIPIIRFRPQEIRAMTGDFSREKIVGESEFASVYRCSLQDEKIVAVKQLKPGAIQGESKFMALINIMNRANHPNLNSLLGYCFTKDFQILVFEFAENNDLSYHLHGISGLSWDIRFKIAKGVAHALYYLHHECHPQIIHREIKPANILLNSTFEAQVADFGFTKLEDNNRSHVMTSSPKTIGYVAPEYGLGCKLTEKSDVYSFGVILTEILTGRTPERKIFDRYPCICEWANAHIKSALANDDISGLVDQKLKGDYNKEEVYKMAKVVLRCIKLKPEDRPHMSEVLEMLEEEPDSYNSHGTNIPRDEICVDSSNVSVGEPCYADVPRYNKPEACAVPC